ncbi:MAG TPA: putative zinc-binding protein [Chitinispirillaceae bacterium]|nr:putative zinc-binding protein [Chitinispirillaceae bacterium]
MKTQTQCSCNTVSTQKYVALSCSGASDLGELADKVCRKIRSDMPNASMNCLAKLGFGEQSLRDTLDKDTALVIDGCPVDCGKKIMEKNGITNFKHVRLTDFGYVKGQTAVIAEAIDAASCKVKKAL